MNGKQVNWELGTNPERDAWLLALAHHLDWNENISETIVSMKEVFKLEESIEKNWDNLSTHVKLVLLSVEDVKYAPNQIRLHPPEYKKACKIVYG